MNTSVESVCKIFLNSKNTTWGPSLVVQWLRLSATNAGGLGLIPGQETRSHMPKLRPGTAKLKKKKNATWYANGPK